MTRVIPDRWYSVADLAKSRVILGLGRAGIYRAILEGIEGKKLTAHRFGTRNYKIHGSDILTFLSQI